MLHRIASIYTGWAKRRGHRLMTTILSNLYFKFFFTGRFLGKFAVKWILKIPLHLAYVATLPRDTLIMSAKHAINDKLQGSVATYLRRGGVVNNQIKKGLVLSEWKKIKIGEYLARTWLSHALSPSFSSVLARSAKCTRQSRSCQLFTDFQKNRFKNFFFHNTTPVRTNNHWLS